MAAITNEASLLNVRGTVAMSLNGTNPDSAERAWFINLTNNTSFDTGTTNGGPYTVFGQILGDGMVVVDKIADVPIYSWNTNFSFSSIPLQDLVASQRTILVRNLIAVKSVATLPFYAISSDPNAFSIKVNGTNLTITFLAYTNKSVTITAYASDTNGNTMKSSFFVQPNPQGSQTISFPAIGDQNYTNKPFSFTAPTASSGLPVTLTLSGPIKRDGAKYLLTGEGTVTLIAIQSGNINYSPSTPATNSFAVTKRNQKILFPSIADQTVNEAIFSPFTITNASPEASSDLPVKVTVSGPAKLSGDKIRLTGTVTLTAGQVGNAKYNPAPNQSINFVVGSK
jgi:hypothetical protein